MYLTGFLKCPHLQMSSQGALCEIRNNYIKNMSDADIRLCMNRHYEACFIYLEGLQNSVVTPLLSPPVPRQESSM
ncbi:MAG: hypothetical protein K8I29_00405 [Alphaproteobacteria bacterium]|uniref:Uncharacterized protein n=1 Tax=Candidatus Nitrobium versatile TaxID=2884831 RepID=A0A953J9J0_9BACT|nr:hypothetical protein [Candidatus Nitrobium versatile]